MPPFARLALSATPKWRPRRPRSGSWRFWRGLLLPTAENICRLAPEKLSVALRLENVSVSYGDNPPALDGLNLDIAAGEHVALVGQSGGGKSTLFALLLGFVEAGAGRVLLDGVPLNELDLAEWRSFIAHMPQRPHLFDGDVTENVAMGRRPESGDVETAVARALAAARADGLVARLPEGVRTRLGENGFGLSGGEAQRLALARAFYRPARLVLFDEPTAHLDPATEQDLAEAIAERAVGADDDHHRPSPGDRASCRPHSRARARTDRRGRAPRRPAGRLRTLRAPDLRRWP